MRASADQRYKPHHAAEHVARNVFLGGSVDENVRRALGKTRKGGAGTRGRECGSKGQQEVGREIERHEIRPARAVFAI